MDVRQVVTADEGAMRALFAAIPNDDRSFFKEDLDEPAVLRRWVDDERGVRLAAVDDDGRLAAVAAVWPGMGRSSHVGDLRLVVAADRRRQGLGQLLARRALIEALGRGMWKISVQVVAREQGTIDMFLALGFTAEALLRDELCTPEGERQDIILLAHIAEDAAQDVSFAAPERAPA